jgi:hypothetical protein
MGEVSNLDGRSERFPAAGPLRPAATSRPWREPLNPREPRGTPWGTYFSGFAAGLTYISSRGNVNALATSSTMFT